jgi:hypothetical protein
VHGGCSHSKMNHNIDPSCQSFTGNLISSKMKRQKDWCSEKPCHQFAWSQQQ